jgi:glycosyltransferase involved in cell wall biosynthesis
MISILMATYNGEEYLEEQLASIFNQTFTDFCLYVQDDCSTDATMEILKRWKSNYPAKMYYSQRDSNSGKPQINFLELVIAHNQDSYCMLSDQDDVWFSTKIETTYQAMKEYELRYGSDFPILLGTEVTEVDENLVPLKFRRTTKNYNKFSTANRLLSYDFFVGCTVIFNNPLAKKITSVPPDCILHDWWLAFVCSCFGIANILPDSTIYYRQHANNFIGINRKRNVRYYLNTLHRVFTFDHSKIARLFLQQYQSELPKEKEEMIRVYSQLPSFGLVKRLCVYSEYKFWSPGILRNVSPFIQRRIK